METEEGTGGTASQSAFNPVGEFAKMVSFPEIRKALHTFRLGDPVQVMYDDEYLVVAGQPILDARPCNGLSDPPTPYGHL